MKGLVRFLGGWIVPVLLVLPTAGCFTACSRFMGNRPSTAETIACGALDVATLPVQIVVIGPLALGECIDANTGERGRLKRRRKDIERIKGELTADFSRVYSDREFLSPTNTLQREALGEWLGHYNRSRPDRDLIDPLAERLLNEPEAAYALMNILEQENLSPALKKKLCVSLVEGSRTRAKDRQSRVVNRIFNGRHLSEDELRALVSGKSDSTDKVIGECLHRSEMARQERLRREEEASARRKRDEAERRKREKEDAARRKVEEAERLKREKEKWRARERRIAELRGLAGKVDAEYDEFAKALPVRGERSVVDFWWCRFRDTANPLPHENVRKLAEILTEPGEPLNMCCGTLFKRPELTEDDMRSLYARILKKLEEKGEWQQDGWRYAGALIKNPRFPADLVRASYEEPLLSELRVVYCIHRVCWANGEMRKFERSCDELERDFLNGKLSFKKCNAKRFKLTKRYLPAECPDDWVESIP